MVSGGHVARQRHLAECRASAAGTTTGGGYVDPWSDESAYESELLY